MRSDIPDLTGGALSWYTTADIIHSGRTLVRGVPVEAGTLTVVAEQDVPDRVSGLALPFSHGDDVLDPRRPGAKLGVHGHRLALTVHVRDLYSGESFSLAVAHVVVTKVKPDESRLSVDAEGVLSLVSRHKNGAPTVSTARSAREVIAQILSEDGVGLFVAGAVGNAQLPPGFMVGDDRLGTCAELARSIPAVIVPRGDSKAGLVPAPAGTRIDPVIQWSDGSGGALVDAPAEFTREGIVNHVVALVGGQDEDGQTVEKERHEFAIRSGRLSVDTFGYVTKTFTDDSVRTLVQAQAIAEAEFAKSMTRGQNTEVTLATPDLRVELWDPARATTADGTQVTGRIVAYSLPLSSAAGAFTATIGGI